MENNFKFLLKGDNKSSEQGSLYPNQENKAEALVFLKTITQLVEDMKVESPKEIKKKQLGKLTKAELLAMLVEDEDDEPKVTKPKAKTSKPKAKEKEESQACSTTKARGKPGQVR